MVDQGADVDELTQKFTEKFPLITCAKARESADIPSAHTADPGSEAALRQMNIASSAAATGSGEVLAVSGPR